MSINVYFENRDFTPYIPEHWEHLEVQRYTKAAQFGPKKAIIKAYGTNIQMWEFAEMLRCPVYLSDPTDAERKWWGYIHKVEIIGGEGYANLECRGWTETLDWQYLLQEKGRESYEEIAGYGREIGEDKRPTAAQSFQISSSDAWDITAIWLRVHSVGTRSDLSLIHI